MAAAIAVLGLTAGAGGGGGAAATTSGSRQVASLGTTSTSPGSPTGSHFEVEWGDPADSDAQAPGVETMIIQLPAGSKIDSGALPRCQASDAELMASGASACPAASRIGSGLLVSDAGPNSPVPRYTENAVTIFNGPDEQIAFAETKTPPTIRAVGRTMIEGATLRAEIPSFPQGAPPDLSLVSLKRLSFKFDRIVRDGRAYARTPPRCPATASWTTALTFIYRDGVRERILADSPCHADRIRPHVTIRGVPRQECLRRARRVRVRVADQSPLRRVLLRVDRRRLRRTDRARFSARIPLGRLDAGAHRLSVVAVDAAGNVAREARRFRRCKRR